MAKSKTDGPQAANRPRGGCLLIGGALAGLCVLFLANSMVFTSAYAALAANGPPWMQNIKLAQALMFLAPVALLGIEWWMLDALFDFFRTRRRRPRVRHD